jgi:hypothetical protein
VSKLPRYYCTRDSCEKDVPNLPDFGKKKEKRKKVKAIRFRQPVPARSQKIKGFLKFYTLKSIWQNIYVDDRQFGYNVKLEKKIKFLPRSPST